MQQQWNAAPPPTKRHTCQIPEETVAFGSLEQLPHRRKISLVNRLQCEDLPCSQHASCNTEHNRRILSLKHRTRRRQPCNACIDSNDISNILTAINPTPVLRVAGKGDCWGPGMQQQKRSRATFPPTLRCRRSRLPDAPLQESICAS